MDPEALDERDKMRVMRQLTIHACTIHARPAAVTIRNSGGWRIR